MQKQKGHYLGTEINEKWYRRYTKDGLLARGNGEYWLDEQGFYFLRYLTKEPIFIPFDKIIEIKIGKWHSGRWAYGIPILKIIWQKDSQKLSSGFIVSKHKEDILELKKTLDEKKP
jgi:hypothetical protein